MNSPMLRATGAVLLTLALAPAVQAQVSTNRVAAETAWSVFVDENPKECWAVSAPTETVNTKDGNPVSVRRGDILLFVTYRPGNPVELSFTGGYPFAEGSTVSVDIGGTKFELSTFTDSPEWAWSGSPDEDAKIVAALKAGASAVLTARSSRGTQTKDTFSLIGVSSALDQAEKRCAG
ncbi:invasion associated locus B family protein [Albidovulum litorale]